MSHTNSQEDDATQDRSRKLVYSDIVKGKPTESHRSTKNQMNFKYQPNKQMPFNKSPRTKHRNYSSNKIKQCKN